MADETKPGSGSSMLAIAAAGVLALGAAGAVFWCQDQAQKAERALLQAKDEYRQMSEKMKKPVEEYGRRRKGQPAEIKEEPQGDMLTFLDRKAREVSVPPGSLVISKNANATIGNWVESSYTATLQGTKDAPIRKGPVVDFLSRVERDRKSAKTKSIQITFAGEDFKQAIITFSQFQPK
jgi:hypothetical protein